MNTLPDNKPDLTILARQINELHEEAQDHANSAVQCAIDCGQRLIEAKAMLAHGEFLPWLKANCEVTERHAQRYMRVARELPNATRVSDFSSLREALAALAPPEPKPATPDRRVPSPFEDAPREHFVIKGDPPPVFEVPNPNPVMYYNPFGDGEPPPDQCVPSPAEDAEPEAEFITVESGELLPAENYVEEDTEKSKVVDDLLDLGISFPEELFDLSSEGIEQLIVLLREIQQNPEWNKR